MCIPITWWYMKKMPGKKGWICVIYIKIKIHIYDTYIDMQKQIRWRILFYFIFFLLEEDICLLLPFTHVFLPLFFCVKSVWQIICVWLKYKLEFPYIVSCCQKKKHGVDMCLQASTHTCLFYFLEHEIW